MAAENERLAGDAGPEGAARAYGPVQGPKRDKLIAEAEALVHYVAGHGAKETNGTDGAERLKVLAEAVEAANAETHPEPIDERWTRLVVAYERLASVTYARCGVNGRTVLDTQGRLAFDGRSAWLRFLPRVIKRVTHCPFSRHGDGSLPFPSAVWMLRRTPRMSAGAPTP